MTIFLAILPAVLISTTVICIVVFLNPVRKKIKDLNGKVTPAGDGLFDLDGRQVTIKYARGSRGRSPDLRLSVAGNFAGQLAIRKETGFDRFCKNIGLNREFQTLDEELNDAFYFECDDPLFLKQLFLNPDVKPLLMEAFRQFTSIEISKTICVFRRYPSESLEGMPKEEIEQKSRQMLAFARHIPAVIATQDPASAVFKRRAFFVYFISISLLVAGIMAYIWAEVQFRVIEGGRLWSFSLFYGIPLFLAYSFLLYSIIKGYARSARVFSPCVLFTLVGMLLLGRFGTAIYNGSFDVSDPHRFESVVLDKYFQTNKRTRSYFVVVTPWHGAMKPWALSVAQGEYDQVQPGQTQYEIVTRAGCLGFEWLVSQRVIWGNASAQNVMAWPGRDYSHWYPLPDHIADMPQEEFEYWQRWCKVMEDGVTNRLNVQTDLDADRQAGNFNAIFAEFQSRQEDVLSRLARIVPPDRLKSFQDNVILAGQDQIRFYEEYARQRQADASHKLTSFLSNVDLKAGDEKLWAAYHYFQSLYPSRDKATNDAIERRLAEFDII